MAELTLEQKRAIAVASARLRVKPASEPNVYQDASGKWVDRRASSDPATVAAQGAKYPSGEGAGMISRGVGGLAEGFGAGTSMIHSPLQSLMGLPSMAAEALKLMAMPRTEIARRAAMGEEIPDPMGMKPIFDKANEGDYAGAAGYVPGMVAGGALTGKVLQSGAQKAGAAVNAAPDALMTNAATLRNMTVPNVSAVPTTGMGALAQGAKVVAKPVFNMVAAAEEALARKMAGTGVKAGGKPKNLAAAEFPEFDDPIPTDALMQRTDVSPKSVDAGTTPWTPPDAPKIAAERPKPAPVPPPMSAAELQRSQLKKLYDGINPGQPNQKGVTENVAKLMKQEPQLLDLRIGDEFDQGIVDAFRKRELEINKAADLVPKSTTVNKLPILARWRQIVQDAKLTEWGKPAAEKLEAILNEWNELPDAVPWDQFRQAKQKFLKNPDAGIFRKAYQELMDAEGRVSTDLGKANAAYSTVRRAKDAAKINITRDEFGNILYARRQAPPIKR